MKKAMWVEEYDEFKIKTEDCTFSLHGCGGKNCVEARYRRKSGTMEWQLASSICKKCGLKIIV